VAVRSTLFKFAVVGVLNTLLTLAVIFALKLAFHMADAPANLLGYAVGLINGYSLNRRWTFAHRGRMTQSLPAFLLVQAVAYGVNLLVVLAAIAAGLNDYAAHVVGVLPYALISYLGSRHFAFASPSSGDRA
jgi:putative flippase GtrA